MLWPAECWGELCRGRLPTGGRLGNCSFVPRTIFLPHGLSRWSFVGHDPPCPPQLRFPVPALAPEAVLFLAAPVID